MKVTLGLTDRGVVMLRAKLRRVLGLRTDDRLNAELRPARTAERIFMQLLAAFDWQVRWRGSCAQAPD